MMLIGLLLLSASFTTLQQHHHKGLFRISTQSLRHCRNLHCKDDTSTSESRRRHQRHGNSPTRIITCSSSKELVHAVKTYVRPGQNVAELGSHLRDVSATICNSLRSSQKGQHPSLQENDGHALMVDVTRRFPKSQDDGTRTNAMRLQSDDTNFQNEDLFSSVSTFVEISNLQDWRSAFFLDSDGKSGSSEKSYDVLVLDINAIVGNDLEWTALSIVNEFDAMNQYLIKRSRSNAHHIGGRHAHQLVVLVKSVALNQFATRILHGQRWINSKGDNAAIPPPHIVATVGVQEYRSTIPFTVRPGDAVLEVGCHFGTTTKLLHDAACSSSPTQQHDNAHTGNGYCLGVDVGSKIIKEAIARHPDVYFRVGDAWSTAELLRIQRDYHRAADHATASRTEKQGGRIGFDVVYIDVGGLSGNDGLLEAISLVSSIRYALEPRCIVIKSQCLRRLSSALNPYWHVQEQRARKRITH